MYNQNHYQVVFNLAFEIILYWCQYYTGASIKRVLFLMTCVHNYKSILLQKMFLIYHEKLN